ncbi:MAG: HEAT repeat domain-containing protein [Planctomycetota bacterium]
MLGFLAASCTASPPPEFIPPLTPPPLPEGLQFRTHLDTLIKQLGDNDWRTRESASKEIKSIVDYYIGGISEDPEHLSPNMSYLVKALEYASAKGHPPEVDAAPDLEIKMRALILYGPIRYRLIVHPDLIKLYPEIIDKLQNGDDQKVINWLGSQVDDVQRKGIALYKEFLRSAVSEVRRVAIERLGSLVGEAEVIKDLLPLLKDNDDNVRRLILNILNDKGNASIIPDLLPLTQYPIPRTRLELAKLVIRLGKESVAQELLPLLKDSDASIRYTIVLYIRSLQNKSMSRNLLPLLHDEDENIRANVVIEASQLKDSSLLKDILSLFHDNSAKVRGYAIGTAVELGGESVINDTIPLLKDKSDEVCAKAAAEICRLGGLEIIKRHCNIKDIASWLKSNDTVTQVYTLNILGKLKDASVIKDILPILQNDPDSPLPWVKATAIETLGKLGDKSVAEILIPFLKHKDDLIRRMAIQSLGNLMGHECIADILPLLKDDDLNTREVAVFILAHVGDSSIIPNIIPLLNEANISFHPMIIRTLFKLGGPSVIEEQGLLRMLLPLLQDKSQWTRAEIAQTLALISDKTAANDILPLLTDSDKMVRFNTAYALARIGDIRAIPVWIETVEDTEKIYLYNDLDNFIQFIPIEKIAYAIAEECLEKLTGKKMHGTKWKEWWQAEGKSWYEAELAKLEKK